MATFEETLRDLGIDDDDDGETAVPNKTIKQIRDSQKEWEKKAKEYEKELKAAQAQLTEFNDRARRSVAVDAFKELELPEKQAELFLKLHEGDVTPDAVRQFVQDNGLKDLSSETGGTTEDKSQGFTPGGSGAGGAGTPSKITREDWLKMARSDPARARQMFETGRVDTAEIDSLDPRA